MDFVPVAGAAVGIVTRVDALARGADSFVRSANPNAGDEERAYRDAPPTIPVFSSETVAMGEAREPVWVDR